MRHTTLRNILAAASAVPWAIEPTKLSAIAAFLTRRAAGVTLADLPDAERAAILGEGRRAAPPARARAGGTGPTQIAILPIYGTIAHRAHMVDDISGPGGTSTEKVSAAFDRALRDPDVAAIVFDIDSPGGTVAGVPELADQIFAARGQKPIKAVSNALAASAAYWIGSAADELIVTPSGGVGSVGVYMMHLDVSGALAQDGVAPTLISAGKHKVEGHPYAPLSDEARAQLQTEVDATYDEFVDAVARHFGVKTSAVRRGYGEGRVLDARPAVAEGMAARVATLDQVLAELGAAPAATASSGSRRGETLDARVSPAVPSDTAAGGGPAASAPAAPAQSPSTTPRSISSTPLSPSRSRSVDETENTPPTTQGGTAVAPAAADDRVTLLAELADVHDAHDRLAGWIRNGTSVAAARNEVRAARAGRATALPGVSVGHDRAADRPWASLGEQLMAVANHFSGQGSDPRLYRQAGAGSNPSGGSATVGPDGAFQIGTQFTTDLMSSAFETGVLARRCAEAEIGAGQDAMEVAYLNDTNRTTGNRWGGVQVYRRDEAETVAATKPSQENWTCRLEDMMGLAYMTERQLQDAPQMQSVFQDAFTSEFGYKLDEEIFGGTGVGQCLGFTRSPALVTVAKDGAQAAGTFISKNALDMWSRMPARFRQNAIWVYNQELEPQFPQMVIGTGSAAVPAYLPPGGLSGSQYATLFGRPMLPIEQANQPGQVGDISLVDLQQYMLIRKGGIQGAESIHVRFVFAERAFRWFVRVNGAPKFRESILPAKGSARLSPYVTLAART